jgi:hypothetical protein
MFRKIVSESETCQVLKTWQVFKEIIFLKNEALAKFFNFPQVAPGAIHIQPLRG